MKKITLKFYYIKVEIYLLFLNLNSEIETKILGTFAAQENEVSSALIM